MTSLFSLFGHGLFLIALILFIVQAKRWGKYWPLAYMISAVLIVLPIKDWLVIEFSRGYFSDLSVATIVMCSLYIMNVAGARTLDSSNALKYAVLLLGIVLYPLTLGLNMLDPYAIGFSSHAMYSVFVSALSLIAFSTWYLGLWQLTLVLVLALLANGLSIYESNNIWGYLIDPLAVIMSLGSVVMIHSKSIYEKFNSKVQSDV